MKGPDVRMFGRAIALPRHQEDVEHETGASRTDIGGRGSGVCESGFGDTSASLECEASIQEGSGALVVPVGERFAELPQRAARRAVLASGIEDGPGARRCTTQGVRAYLR